MLRPSRRLSRRLYIPFLDIPLLDIPIPALPLLATAAIALGVGLASSPALAAPDGAADLDAADLDGVDGSTVLVTANRPALEKYAAPQTTAGVTGAKVMETQNILDSEDALKYLPSLFLRKRNNGDTQAVLATRTWGVNSSARTLVYADDVLISALIANNNTAGAPRWGLVAPEEIQRVDVLYGPYSAAYAGNSMGGVVQITTRTPDHLEASARQSESVQSFGLYGTHKDLVTSQTSAHVGDRAGPFTWSLSANYQDSDSQPLSFVTNGKVPTGTTGTFLAQNKTGAVADVVGASGLLHTQMTNAKLKLGYDLSPIWRLSYTAGYWQNDATSDVQTYLRDSTGAATFAGLSGFASGKYSLWQSHLAQSVTLRSDSKGPWDAEVTASHYEMLDDIQRTPTGVSASGTGFSTAGRIARMDGTNWSNVDAKALWRTAPTNTVSAGLHADQYELVNPTYSTATWQGSGDTGQGLYSSGRGKTQTLALWAQDAWTFLPDWTATLGGRLERWQAFDGYNYSGGKGVDQPDVETGAFSPKATLTWAAAADWQVTASFGEAYRFPTVSELYQLVSTGTTYTAPNANLKPERVLSGELAVEHTFDKGHVRLSLFQENTHDALIAQTAFLTGATPVSYTVNVDEVRNRGVELAASREDVLVTGLELSGSVTYVDSTILSDPNFASTTGTTATGKHVPYVPDWRVTLAATYRPDEQWAFTIAGRYSGKQYSTLDNTDSVAKVFGAFDSFLVADIHVNYKVLDNLTLDLGIDNINDEKYFLYHPFPGRTFFGGLKVSL
ncbi:TonB-dependent receptor [Nitrospirillum iridis]|uniref:Iron complex outermembrane receptor protein n=1 Tax=Nitrospirillum iridis TaxID=765888 RepID=A0A7X0B300_9PROT|nr:TonB-dependent receptor [Nitrospirillum iridis]MBB6253765.1 iron complex outermembrane receptor protein [Nitrospirillum iridis]